MSDFTFRLSQEDEDKFSFTIEEWGGFGLSVPMSPHDAVALFEAVEAGIGDYVREMRQAKAEFDAGIKPKGVRDDFEGVGDFNSDDPVERWRAHEAAKGNR